MFITNLVWINNNLDSTKAPTYLSLCKHREIYNGAFVLLRSQRIQERSAKWSSDWMKETIKQHRCDERVPMIRILLLSRAEKGRMLWECLFYIVLFFLHSNPPLRKMRRYFAELAHKCANLSVRKAEFYRAFLTKTLPQLVCGTPVTLPTCGRRLYYKRGQAHCWYSKLADEKLDYERLICRI